MNELKLGSRLHLIAAIFLLGSFSCAPAGLAQSTTTNIQIGNTVLQTPVHRLGVNLGDQGYWDSGQMMKNLVFENPGFEGLKYRVILHCASVTANSCTDDNGYNGQPNGYWAGGTYSVLSGAALGTTGTVVSNTLGASGCGSCGPTIVFDKSVNMAAGDYVALTNYFPGSGDAAWWDDTSGGATITTETTDLSPNTPGKQALLLSAGKSGQLASVAQYFDTNSSLSFIQMNGTFQVAFRAKGVGGNNQLNVNAERLMQGNGPWLSQTLTLTNSWQDYTLNFSASETGSAVGTIQLVFTATGSNVELDDVSLEQTNSSASNTTAFRDDVVNALKELNPGTIRMMAAGAALGSDLPNQLAVPFARYREGFNADYDSTPNVAYGIHEFLQLCQAVGADPWITIPTATTPREMTDFIEYLTGTGGDSFSASRIARGQTAPWTTVFSKIHIELGNETWNGVFKGESMLYPAYPQWANVLFGTARQTSGYQANKFDLILDGWGSVPGYNSTMLTYSTQHDSMDIAPYLLYSANNEPMTTMFGALFAEPEMFDTAGGEVAANVAVANAAPRKTGVSVYETNLGTELGSITQAQLNLLTPSVGAGVATADHMLQMMRAGVQYQNTFSLPQYQYKRDDASIVKLWGIVLDMGTTNRRRPQFLTQALSNSVIGGNMLQTVQSGANPTWNQPLSSDSVQLNGAHYLQSFAFLNGTSISTVLFNLNQTTALPVTFSGPNTPSGSVQMTQITSAHITDNNETSSVVAPTTQTLSAFNAAAGLSLPPFSMTVLTWTSTVTQQPQFSVAAGTYSTTQTVALSDTTPGATIYYTTDGSTPTTSSAVYATPVSVSASGWINAIALAPNFTLSPVATAAYTIQPYAVAPTFSVAAGTYSTSQSVSLSTTTPGASFYYTTDGSTPTTGSTLYSGPITVSTNETLSAIAVASHYSNSPVATAAYTIAPPSVAPVFSVAAGTYVDTQYVSMTDSMAGAVIYYTTNGSTPTSNSNQYTAAITVSVTQTLKAIAVASGYSSSPVTSATYTISNLTAPPTFSPGTGTYNGPQSVSIASATPGAVIYYTTNGTKPTTSSTLYTGPIAVNGTEDIAALTIAPGYTGTLGSALYDLVVATPVLSVPGGAYGGPQTITITTSTATANIYYTMDGSTPNTTSTQYTGPLVISSSKTLKAVGAKENYVSSAVTAATYTVGQSAATPTFSPAAGSYSGAQVVTISDATAGATIYYTTNGTAPTTSSTVYSGPITVSASETVTAAAIATNYSLSVAGSAAYTIGTQTVIPVISVPGGTYYGPQTVTITDATPNAVIYYTTNGTVPTTSSNQYTGPVLVNQAEQLQANAIAPGYSVSPAAAANYSLTVATPALSSPSGTYSSGQTLQITDTTPGAVIFYTTNGSTPSTTSTQYTGPITISSSETIKVLAAETGYVTSAVASATYTIGTGQVTAAPAFSLATGSYATAQSVTITDATAGAVIYYTTDGSTPSTSSAVYTSPILVSSTETLSARAVAPGITASTVTTATYTISQTVAFSFPNGFAAGGVHMNGSAVISGANLELVSGSSGQAGTAWYPNKVAVSEFGTQFDFQLPTSAADGFTFTLENEAAGYWALGGNGSSLGYSGITNSVAVAFDLYQSGVTNAETLSVLTGGSMTPVGLVNLSSSGINLHSGDPFRVQIAYTAGSMTVVVLDKTTGATATNTFAVNVPGVIGSTTAYAGFTGGTGSQTSIQNIVDWVYEN